MAIFFPPPPPFVGGSQPFAGHNGNVPSEAVPVNNPPPSHPGRTVAVIVAAALAWYNIPPPDAFEGGRQPLAPRTLPPSLLAVPVNNPPTGGAWYTEPPAQTILSTWQPPPPDANFGVGQALTPRKLSPALLDVPVNNPPLGGASYTEQPFQTVLATWVPPPPNAYFGTGQPLQPKTLTPSLLDVRVDAPPFGGSAAQEPATLTAIAAWAPPDPNPNFGAGQPLQPRTLSPSRLAVAVNNPPGITAGLPWSLWQPDSIPQQRYAQVIIPPAVVATFVGAVGAVQFETILSAWQPIEFRQIVPHNLPPSILAVPVNNPPGVPQQPNITNWLTAPTPILASLMAPALLAPLSSQPLANVMPQAILVAWQPVTPAPVLARGLPPSLLAVRVDNPPGLVSQPALFAWQPLAPQPPVPLGVAPLLFVAAGQTPYTPLPLSVLVAWTPPDPPPTLPRKLAPSIIAVRVDNPPGLSAVPIGVSAAWLQTPPASIVGNPSLAWLAKSGVPFEALPWSVVTSWAAPDPAPILARNLSARLLAVAVNNPPISTAQLHFGVIASAWQPIDPVRQPYARLVLTARVDNPPRSSGLAPSIMAAWQQPAAPFVMARLSAAWIVPPAPPPPPVTMITASPSTVRTSRAERRDREVDASTTNRTVIAPPNNRTTKG